MGSARDLRTSATRQLGQVTILDVGQERLRTHGWDIAICLTHLPLRSRDNRPLVADVSRSRRTAVMSLPAFGAMHLTRRVRNVVLQIVAELAGQGMDNEYGVAGRSPGRKGAT